MAMSDYLRNTLINAVFRNTTYTSQTTVYIALLVGNTEVSGNGYARQVISLSSPADGATSNNSNIIFPVATGAWGTITNFAIFDALTGGNELVSGALNTPEAVMSGSILKILANQLTVSFV